MSDDNKHLTLPQLLQRELTRKEFLQVMAVVTISVLGFNNLVSMLTKFRQPAHRKGIDPARRRGFGSSKFGA
jgi:hypothetical protein